ncbi:MAG: hypothetical protein CL687_04675 [Candidatus Pelagibacter sp.]|nr:hypothetical protein [Candidatus Pelagibacter sp.]OUW23442.1 MAG: hypothetical protein CBD34_03070 [Rickettsiales bacterium TMED174]
MLFISFSNFISKSETNFQQKKFYYENLVNNWSKIFPDGNRNAAGPRFFKYLIDQNLTYNEFLEYNKFYCPVSGSLINPGEKPDFIFVKDIKLKKNICGDLYRCCWPCSCDLMNYTKVKKIKHKFKDVSKKINVLLIDNPCSKKDFPKEVNRNYFCNKQKLNKDEVFVVDGKLVIGLLYNARNCKKADINKIKSNEITGSFCAFKNDIPLDEMNIGMGDIFIRMAR